MNTELSRCLSGFREHGDGPLLLEFCSGSQLLVQGYKRKNLVDLQRALNALQHKFQINYSAVTVKAGDRDSFNWTPRLLQHFKDDASIPLLVEPITGPARSVALPAEYDCVVTGSQIAESKIRDLSGKFPNDHRPIAAVFGAMAYLYDSARTWRAAASRDGTTVRIFFQPTETLHSERLVELGGLLYDTVQLYAIFLYPRAIEVVLLATSNGEYTPFNRALVIKRQQKQNCRMLQPY